MTLKARILSIYLSIYPNPSARAGYDTRSIFKQSLTGFNSEFSYFETSCLTQVEEPSLPYYLTIAGGRIIEFIAFPRVLVLYEMQSVSSRIWTRFAVSISYEDNHYTTDTSHLSIYLSIYQREVPMGAHIFNQRPQVYSFSEGKWAADKSFIVLFIL